MQMEHRKETSPKALPSHAQGDLGHLLVRSYPQPGPMLAAHSAAAAMTDRGIHSFQAFLCGCDTPPAVPIFTYRYASLWRRRGAGNPKTFRSGVCEYGAKGERATCPQTARRDFNMLIFSTNYDVFLRQRRSSRSVAAAALPDNCSGTDQEPYIMSSQCVRPLA
jgi:hypothetical protein